jgi:Protein of unknown function, DUF547
MINRRGWIGLVALAALPGAAPAQGLEALFAPRARLWPRWSGHDEGSTRSVDHAPWTAYLRRYRRIGSDGIARLDYAAVTAADAGGLEAWLGSLAAIPVTALRREEQFCFWVNLYNALTVRTVLQARGVASIRDINLSGGVLLRGPWDAHLATIEGEALSLNDIEHRILRPIWRDPRLHYVVNCASLGCPNLPETALTPARREAMLTEAARGYVAHPRGVTVRPDGLLLSSIYNWFAGDFEPDGGVVPHLLRHAEPTKAAAIRAAPGIAGYAYDWALNRAAG